MDVSLNALKQLESFEALELEPRRPIDSRQCGNTDCGVVQSDSDCCHKHGLSKLALGDSNTTGGKNLWYLLVVQIN
jgi:hypothetical protein